MLYILPGQNPQEFCKQYSLSYGLFTCFRKTFACNNDSAIEFTICSVLIIDAYSALKCGTLAPLNFIAANQLADSWQKSKFH